MMHALIAEAHGPELARKVSDWFMHTDIRPAQSAQRASLTERYGVHDELVIVADILLPDQVDLESLQLIYVGGSKYIEQFWKHEGYALRQPAVKPAVDARAIRAASAAGR